MFLPIDVTFKSKRFLRYLNFKKFRTKNLVIILRIVLVLQVEFSDHFHYFIDVKSPVKFESLVLSKITCKLQANC